MLGLQETDHVGGKLYLKAWDEQEHHPTGCWSRTRSPGLNCMAFRLESPDDLEVFEDKLERNEYRVQRVSMGDEHALGEAIRFTRPAGTASSCTTTWTGRQRPARSPTPIPMPMDLVGIHPPRLDHSLLTAPETAPTLVPLLREVAGLPPDRAA